VFIVGGYNEDCFGNDNACVFCGLSTGIFLDCQFALQEGAHQGFFFGGKVKAGPPWVGVFWEGTHPTCQSTHFVTKKTNPGAHDDNSS
jgi:hypothetical protein